MKNEQKTKRLDEKIETLRDNLHILILEYGIDSKEVLICSQELDNLIYKSKTSNRIRIDENEVKK